MRQARFLAWGAVVGLMLAAWPCAGAPPAAATGAGAPATARAAIEKVTQAALVVLRDASLSLPEKRVRARQIAYDYMDFPTLARLALGRPWRTLTEAQRADFVTEFRKHVASTYSHMTDQYTDEDIKVTADHEETDGDSTVQTTIIGTKDGVKQDVAKVDYRLRKLDDRWKIIDVSIDGVSLMSNFRAQFQEIMNQGGIDQVLKMLREKNAAVEKADGVPAATK